jgi:hypothetical protein
MRHWFLSSKLSALNNYFNGEREMRMVAAMNCK